MLLLTLGFIKDAAKAVKRICKEEFTEVKDSVLTELLGIPTLLVNMFSLRREGDHEVLHLWCSHRGGIALCPRCGSICTTVHEDKERCVRHLDIWEKKTFLHFLSRRFECDRCRKPFTEELPFVEAHRRQSIAFEQKIYNQCLSSNRKKIALQEELSQSTVRDIFNRWARLKADKSGFMFTQVLGIDEISLKKRHKQYALVISDIERKCILAVLPIREKQALEEWLMQLTENQRKVIRFVSVDMWKPYHQAARKILPHAKIVVDRFHVMKQLNDRLAQLRRRIQNEGTEEIKAVMKGSRWILVRNRSGLSVTEETHLQKILDLCPEIRHLYLLKEEFRQIFERIHNREKACRFLRCWKQKVLDTGNKYLMKFLKTLENFWDEIMNYFLERITNGFVEGLNGAIRTIIRRAFGYRNFQDFRFRIFAELGFPTNPR